MVKYLVKIFVIICVILPFYLKVRKPWKKETGREIVLGIVTLFITVWMASLRILRAVLWESVLVVF